MTSTLETPTATDDGREHRPTKQDLLDGIAALEPRLTAAADYIERERDIPADIIQDLYDLGVFKSFLPRELGGVELDPTDWLEVVEALSMINGSAGWLAMILSGHTNMTPDVVDKMMSRPGARWILGTNGGRAAGRARRVDGGYRVSGRWPFASGSPHASFAGGVAFLYDDDGEIVLHPKDHLPWVVLGIVPDTEFIVHDTWDGLGLRGTGSGDIELDDVFIPEERVLQDITDWPYDAPLYRHVLLFQIAGHAAHALGIARASLDEFIRMCNRVPAAGSSRQSTLGRQQHHQIIVARADAMIRAARLLAFEAVGNAFEAAQGLKRKESIDLELRVLIREATTYAVRTSKEVVNMLFEQAGTGAVKKGGYLEVAYRDISVAGQHIMHTETTLALSGQYWISKDRPGGPEVEGGTMAFF